MNASPEENPRDRGRELRVLGSTSSVARARVHCRLPTLAELALRNPKQSLCAAPRRPPARTPRSSSSPPADPQPEHYLPGPERPRVHLVPLPHPGVAGRRPGGARAAARGREAREQARARRSAYLPWASRMAACDSAGTWPPPPGRGWRRGELGPRWQPLKLPAAGPHQLLSGNPTPPATAAAATAPAPASVMAGPR